MTVSYRQDFYNVICTAIDHAKVVGKRCVVSEVKAIESIDPLDFYHTAAKQYRGERFFWESQSTGFALVGAGVAVSATAEGDNDTLVRDILKQLRNTATVTGISGIEGTGPLLFGGHTFDSTKQSSKEWASFGCCYFFLPTFLVTKQEGQYYLTRTVVCEPGDHADELMRQIQQSEDTIFRNVKMTHWEKQPWNPLLEQKDQDLDEWTHTVDDAIQIMEERAIKKIVLARTRKMIFQNELSSDELIRSLREQQENTCVFCLEKESAAFLGATPERLIKKSGRRIYSACLAGSVSRAKTDEEDSRLGEWLLNDRKNRMEHQYVVSAVRDSLTDLCEQLTIPNQPVLMKNKNIQHLYTSVEGLCAESASVFDFVKRLHPTPALGGLPRKAAMDWIREHERLNRGFYASPIGWCDAQENGEFDVGIRSALINGRNVLLYAGCGLLKDSIPKQEYEETAIKFKPMLNALTRRNS
ncbi:isochorismate synthase [Sporolactobacillus nakayamae]|uniref:isochorismate synthase n=1 Tax=Sporolactobacillus nakayamae TaxID=269670 RepID=A0A1I2N866_9BACL|nr:isochorismate synthase [Sporolactobacillus nakayamae]SFF97927.1 isochorismate synthase [Sporolactobacillus nakayamae]